MNIWTIILISFIPSIILFFIKNVYDSYKEEKKINHRPTRTTLTSQKGEQVVFENTGSKMIECNNEVRIVLVEKQRLWARPTYDGNMFTTYSKKLLNEFWDKQYKTWEANRIKRIKEELNNV